MAKTRSDKNKKKQNPDKKRKISRECMRKLRENIKNDPVKHEEAKKKERERYHSRKAAGKIKCIVDMSEREKRLTRKKWKDRSKRSYEAKKREKNLQIFLTEHTPPTSPRQSPVLMIPAEPDDSQAVHTPRVTFGNSRSRVASGEKIRRKNRRMLTLRVRELEKKLSDTEKKARKYKKQAHRLKNKTKKKNSPRTNIDNLVSGSNVGDDVKKKLLFGEVISTQIRENFRKLHGSKQKRKFIEHISGPIVRKYGFKKFVGSLSSCNIIFGKSKNERLKQRYFVNVQRQVISFLSKDENSRLCPGKRDTITYKKNKMQKRYLNDTLSHIYAKFKIEYPNLNLSYSTFCKMRPFWIVQPVIKARDTCLCLQHTNMSLLISKLNYLKIIDEKTPEILVKSYCCNGGYTMERCLERKCSDCKYKEIRTSDYDANEDTYYEKWVTKKETFMIKGKEKQCQRTVKERIICKKEELVVLLKNTFDTFLLHIRNIKHQYRVIDEVKKKLSTDEILIHCDFSENYACKYNEEVQSAHFGASKPQVTLHTVVIYYKNAENASVVPLSICTLSDSLRHDPSAICAHLKLAINEIKKYVPFVDTVHFLSDGPSTQYKNKKMFFLMVNYLADCLLVNKLRWHYSESGHGKGAPDGIGGFIKREADRRVAMGKDIPNFQSLVESLKDSNKVKIIALDSEELEKVDEIVPDNLLVFKGTMKIHEVCWSRKDKTVIQARHLSCLECDVDKDCHHYGLGHINVQYIGNGEYE